MTRIKLKRKSPEYDDERRKVTPHICDIDGCDKPGEFRAPKDRDLKDYYHFCKDHVTDYNRAWNYFDGMSDRDIQNKMYQSLFGDRPTWKFTGNIDLEEELRRKTYDFYGEDAPKKKAKAEEKAKRPVDKNSPEGEALEIMGISPPTDLEEIKATYKKLAKQYHPDVNNGCEEAEEKLKDINMAYTVLRLAYQKYEETLEKFS